ncbi:unnamed protein product [Clonostachys solani]|uniref:Peptidase C15, pyroglutamyl peptidase I-like protein n=1 Tax=Clonostachys solani TaxID=160281 RepID=A0A9N9ZG68_9HYPO|nr:unnamed protein product [Clonostachys solani]
MSHIPVRVLVTGFGAFKEITVNPSFEIVKRLPPSLADVEIIAHPEPTDAVYHKLLEVSPRLIQQHNPTIVLHIGLAVERDYFAGEQSAPRDGYHEYPDMERKVISKLDVKKIWGKKSAENISSSFDLESVVEVWKQNLTSRSDNKARGKREPKSSQQHQPPDVRFSDDVGTWVCGLVYYSSLVEFSKGSGGQRNVVFLHVPPLAGDSELEMGKEVVLCLIMALVESLQ